MGGMKEVLVGIREDQEQALQELVKRRKSSRAALIRDAIDRMLKEEQPAPLEESFGAWGDKTGDGLAYERAIREEWDRDDW